MGEHLPDPDHETALLKRWQDAGDKEALDELLRAQVRQLKAQLRARNMDRASMGASDFAAEAVFRYLRQDPAPHFDAPTSLRAYLFRAARNLLTDHLRARRGDTVRLDSTDAPVRRDLLALSGGQDSLEAGEQLDALEVALNLLSEEDRRVIELTYLEGKKGAEAAEALGIKPEALRMRLVRARRRLGRLLADWHSLVG